jgi:EAL domain-containing protein (putative c-di-GMP-specific phosphodiesterase class I)/FixJ family two-component response regulator
MPEHGQRLLVVDDDPEIASLICDVADGLGYETTAVIDATEFRRKMSENFDIIVLDLMIPDMDGFELIRFLSDNQCTASIFMVSGCDRRVLNSARQLAEERRLRVIGTLTKPMSIADLETELSKVSANQPSRNQAPLDRPDVEQVRQAIFGDQLRVHYQPKLNLKTGIADSVEALVRWQHPERGLLPPSMFLPTVIEANLINALTLQVLDTALDDLWTWDTLGMPVESIAMNFEADSLSDLALPERIMDRLSVHGVSPERLTIEVTESSVIGTLTEALEVLARLRMRGVHLSIDDFGTGHSTLTQLERFPFNELKIDRSFTDGIVLSPESRAIVHSTIGLAQELGLSVVAEGVETYRQLEMLIQAGCDKAQGYLIARPLAAAEMEAWYATMAAESISPAAVENPATTGFSQEPSLTGLYEDVVISTQSWW